jgi:hypothetical protein
LAERFEDVEAELIGPSELKRYMDMLGQVEQEIHA